MVSSKPEHGPRDQGACLEPDPLVSELQRLAPHVRIGGGSFAHWLPSPREVMPSERAKLRTEAERKATRKCLEDLLAGSGLPTMEPKRQASGARNWPAGYVGSVSHKGTKVVAALVPVGCVKSLGIDIETWDGAKELSKIQGLTGIDEFPPLSDVPGPLILFSVKEAVFKALHPILDRQFGFEDVKVLWSRVESRSLYGAARVGAAVLDIRCSVAIPSWVASVALLPAGAVPRIVSEQVFDFRTLGC